jgi:AcrR family transcriptional regulator
VSIYNFLASFAAGFDKGSIMDKPKTPAREKLLNAARTLFFENGVDETSTAEICRLSGVSNGSLFHHFENKEAIAVAIFLDVRRDYWAHVLSAMEAQDDVLDAAEASVYAALDW